MKREQRLPYFALTEIPIPMWGSGAILCSFCQYAFWSGWCKEPEIECEHPILTEREETLIERVQMNSADCWGFRPCVSLAEADGMVANWLQGKDAILSSRRSQ